MDFITAGDYKNYLARMFQFDWTKVCLVMIASAIFFLLIYTITQWKYLSFRGIGVCMLLGVYMGCVAGVTLYNRTPSGVHRANLDLFWSYREYFETGSKIRIVENVCNIVMLVPFGILVPLLLRWTRNFVVFFSVILHLQCLLKECSIIRQEAYLSLMTFLIMRLAVLQVF